MSLFLDPSLEQLGDDNGPFGLESGDVFRHSKSPSDATEPEEAVVGLGVDALDRISLARRWVRVKTRGFLPRNSLMARVVFPEPPPSLI